MTKKGIYKKVVFGYDNSVNLQTDDVGHVGAAVLARVACHSMELSYIG